jgi:hypothetical protein
MASPLATPTLTPTATPTTYGENDVQNRVKNIASQDSALNQMARTEAAKVMNSRGMLNSSMYAGAAQDAVLRQAVPIASQESSQAFQGHEAGLQRASTEGMQAKDIASQQLMQQKSLTAAEQSQIRDIRSREGQAAADRAQAQLLQQKDIASQKSLQQADIGFRTGQGALDRASQEKLASWNLKSTDRNAAAQFLTNMETMYQSAYQSVMSNPNLDATQRTAQLTAAKTMRDKQLNFVEQMYNIDLNW